MVKFLHRDRKSEAFDDLVVFTLQFGQPLNCHNVTICPNPNLLPSGRLKLFTLGQHSPNPMQARPVPQRRADPRRIDASTHRARSKRLPAAGRPVTPRAPHSQRSKGLPPLHPQRRNHREKSDRQRKGETEARSKSSKAVPTRPCDRSRVHIGIHSPAKSAYTRKSANPRNRCI
jgi:hypothetical protein